MKSWTFVAIFISLLNLSACKKDIAKVVEANLSEFTEPVSMTVTPTTELGEVLVASEAQFIEIKIRNNSRDQINKLKLSIDPTQNLLKYRENDEGFSKAPGFGGTCQAILAPSSTCTYTLSFNPTKSGKFKIPVLFDYVNRVEKQSKSVNFTVLTGEPASLIFTSDAYNYNLPVIERTERNSSRFIGLDVKNAGGLNARNITYAFKNTIADGAFSLEENTCPELLGPSETCKLKISYTPKNSEENQTDVDYKSQFNAVYEKDPINTKGYLNAAFNVTSASIEASFKANIATIDYGTTLGGNKLVRQFKLTNNGYREGILKKFIFKSPHNNSQATCTKSESGKILICKSPTGDILPQSQFPFIIEDTDTCMNTEVHGVQGESPGQSCIFKVTYWPSKDWNIAQRGTVNNFLETKLDIIYDSRWKSNEKLVTKSNVISIDATYSTPAKMNVEKIIIGDKEILLSEMNVNSNTITSDLGRIALLRMDSLVSVQIILKNEGEYSANIKSVQDGKNNSFSTTPLTLNTYYQDVALCNISGSVAPDVRCALTFGLNPREQATVDLQNDLMYDIISDKIKKFIFSYETGAMYEDNGTPALERNLTVELKAQLVGKAVLKFATVSPLQVESMIAGKSKTEFIEILNIGTNDASAIIEDSLKNFTQVSTTSWPFSIIPAGSLPAGNLPNGSPQYIDCKNILYPKNTTVTVYDSNKILLPGQTCRLAINVEEQNTYRIQKTERTGANNYKRAFFVNSAGESASGTQDIWERKTLTQSPVNIAFSYYDGDTQDVNAANFLLNFGAKNSTPDFKISASFKSPANIILDNPTPITSAVLNRPRITYPSIAGNGALVSYQTDRTLGGNDLDTTNNENYFYSEHFSGVNTYAKSSMAVPRIISLPIHGSAFPKEYKLHIGTYPALASKTYNSSVTLRNIADSPTSSTIKATFSQDSATSFSSNRNPLSFDTTTAPNAITLASFAGEASALPKTNIVLNNSGAAILKFDFTPTLAGLYKRCFDLTYFDQIISKTLKTCVYAEAVANTPELKIEYWDASVTISAGVISESFPVSPTGTLSVANNNLPLNSTSPVLLTFSAVKGSDLYAKRRFRITNIGLMSTNSTFESLYLQNLSDATTSLPTEVTKSNISGSCGSTILPNNFCEFDVAYKAKTTSLPITLRNAFVYATAERQYVSQIMQWKLDPVDTAKISITGADKLAGVDWSDPTNPKRFIDDGLHYTINLGDYSLSSHYVLSSANPSKVAQYFLANSTGKKASFLKMNPSAATTGWSLLYEKEGEVKIEGNPGCFYGSDDVSNQLAGFTGTTTCQIQVTFKGYKTYNACNLGAKTKTELIGGKIETSCNPYVYKLSYWSNDRDTFSDLYLSLKGFIEPNQVTGAAITNVAAINTSSSTGKVTLSVPTLTGTSAWGPVSSYILYYSNSPDALKTDQIFTRPSTLLSLESAGNFEINNLEPNRYYYFKVVAKRTKDSIEYLSASTNPILAVPVPGASYYYDHTARILVDKNADLSTPRNRSAAINFCLGKNYPMYLRGATTLNISKKLINSQIWNNIIGPNGVSEYGNIPMKSVPHWLSDDKVYLGIGGPLMTIDGNSASFPSFNSAVQIGSNLTSNIAYTKSCGTASCDTAYRIVGGDGEELPYMGAYYTDNADYNAYPRCFADVLCPGNTSKKITDSSCPNP